MGYVERCEHIKQTLLPWTDKMGKGQQSCFSKSLTYLFQTALSWFRIITYMMYDTMNTGPSKEKNLVLCSMKIEMRTNFTHPYCNLQLYPVKTKNIQQHITIVTDRYFLNRNEIDCLCGLLVRVSGYRYRGLGFDSRRYQIFWVVVGLEQGPLSLMRSIEELLE